MDVINEKKTIDNNSQLLMIIKNNSKKIIFNKDDHILKAGEIIKYVYYLMSGRAKIVHYCEDGSMQVLKIVSKDSMICSNPVLNGFKSRNRNIIAETSCETYAIKLDTFYNLINSSNVFRYFILKDQANSKTSIIDDLLEVKYKTKEEVLYDFLINNIDLSKSIDEFWYPQEVCYTQQELGDFIGVSRITITTLLKKLCIEGRVRKINNKIYVKINSN